MRNFTVPMILALLVVAAVGGGIWLLSNHSPATSSVNIQIPWPQPDPEVQLPASSAASPLLAHTSSPGVERRYLNDALHFSFALPDGFSGYEQETGVKNTQAVIVVNKAGHGFLITAESLKTGSGALTAKDIQPNAPDEHVSDIQPIKVAGGITGFVFHTDNKLWKGDGVALWFTSKGYLYKVAARSEDSALLDLVRVTWWSR